jgi:hypothetical protein
MKFAFLTLVFATCSFALDNEYPGFVHIRAWRGNVTDLKWFSMQPAYLGADDAWVVALAKDLCSSSPSCNALWWQSKKFMEFRNRVVDPDYDIYLGVNTSVLPSTMCQFQSHAGQGDQQKYSPQDTWVSCYNADHFGGTDTTLLSFNLPPDLIHSACLKNPKCIGFRVKNDQGSGDLLRNPYPEHLQATGSFRLSH